MSRLLVSECLVLCCEAEWSGVEWSEVTFLGHDPIVLGFGFWILNFNYYFYLFNYFFSISLIISISIFNYYFISLYTHYLQNQIQNLKINGVRSALLSASDLYLMFGVYLVEISASRTVQQYR